MSDHLKTGAFDADKSNQSSSTGTGKSNHSSSTGTGKSGIRVQFDHITLIVTDLDESESFYRDVLGMKQISEPFKEGRHVWFDLGGAELHIVRAAEKRIEHPRGHHFCIRVDDLDAFMDRLKSNGVVYINSKEEAYGHNIRPDGVRQIYFTDPDGYWIEVNDAW